MISFKSYLLPLANVGSIDAGTFLTELMKPISGLVVDVSTFLFGNSPNGLFGPIMKLAVGVEDFLKAVFTPIWDVAVDAVSFIGGIMEPLKNVAVDAVNFLLGLLQPIFKVQVGVLQFVSGIFAPIFEVAKKFKISDH